MKKPIGKGWVSIGAAALGVVAVTGHHASEANVDPSLIALAKSETARGIAFGAGGGAAVGLVTKASIVEIMSRIFVGGLMAAVAAPWLAETVLKVPVSSTAYPVLCCSIGVLGYQMVHNFIERPESIPVIGKVLGPFSKGSQSATDGRETAPVQSPPATSEAPPSPVPSAGNPAPVLPLPTYEPERRPRVPLARS
jgi:hypothetical protein